MRTSRFPELWQATFNYHQNECPTQALHRTRAGDVRCQFGRPGPPASARRSLGRDRIMRILIGTGGGFLVGLLALIQFMGWFQFCPSDAFRAVHAPAVLLAGWVVHGEARWDVIPFTMVVQWLIIGALVGVVFHLVYVSKRSTH